MNNHYLNIFKLKLNKFSYFFSISLSPNHKLIVLLYHRVLPELGSNKLGTIVSIDTFKKQINTIKEKYYITSMDDILEQIKNNNIRHKTQVIISFDDGYVDNYKYVFPILSEMNVKATFFLVTDYINSKKSIWDSELATSLEYNHQSKHCEPSYLLRH